MDTITIKFKAQNGHEYPETYVVDDLSKVSDGYHTIAELYDHRITLFITLLRVLKKASYLPYNLRPWRSKIHSDGSMFDGQFILGIGLDTEKQITYHIPLDCWNETDFAETCERAPKWDGHTSADVLERLKNLCST